MPKLPAWLHGILLWLAFTAGLVPVSGAAFYVAAMMIGPQYMKRAVSYPPPDEFPVLVVTPSAREPRYQAQIVYFRNLEKFLKEHPDAGFLVPEGWAGRLNDQLYWNNRQQQQIHGKEADFDVPFWQSFQVKRLADGRQRLQVNAPIDDDEPDRSWYEATATSFTPLYHQHYVTVGMSMGAAFLAVPAAAAFSIIVAAALVWWVEHRRLKRAAAPK